MEIPLVVAYLLPIMFLMAFIGRAGKKFIIYLFWGFLASVPMLVLFLMNIPELSVYPFGRITVSPLLEEFFKALPVIIPALMGIKNQDEDVLVYAMASGIGFSLVENGIYFFLQNLQSGPGSFLMVLGRSFSTSLMHGCTCGIIGYGIVLIRNFDRRALPALLFGFYTIAVTIHALYNLFLSSYFGIIGTTIDFIFPMVLFFFLLTGYRVDLSALFKKDHAM